jgi:hypothetical protein
MKPIVLLFLAALALPAAAQVRFSVRAGVNVATLEADDSGLASLFDFEDRLGLTGGVAAELPLSSTISLRPELLYTMKGATRQLVFDESIGLEGYDVTMDATYAFDYVELPVLLDFAIPTPVLRGGLLVGPTLSLNVRDDVTFDVRGTIGGEPITEEEVQMLIGPTADRWVERTDVGVTLGLRGARGPLYADVRFTLGLPVVSDRDDDGRGFAGVRNRAFAVSVGYTL